MRKSLILGVLTCALIIAGSTDQTEAATVNTNQIDIVDTTIVELLADANSAKLVVLSELSVKEQKNLLDTEPEIIKHVVAENESLEKIAKKYETTWQRLYDKNLSIVDPDVIKTGDEIVVPAKEEVLEQRAVPVPVAKPQPVKATKTTPTKASVKSVSSSTAVSSSRGSSTGNGYTAGYCTWYVKSRRPDLPNNLGNASTWFARASAQGIPTGYTARAGAVAQRNNHVAYVESVNGDGTMTISEMNYRNLYEKTVRVVSSSEWKFIY